MPGEVDGDGGGELKGEEKGEAASFDLLDKVQV